MPWSIKLGQVFGIDIKVHLSFVLILVWGAFVYGGDAGPLYGLLVTIALFSLVLMHELGHSLAALGYGIPVRDITLLPIGGVARLERMPEKPLPELVVALAGPFVNIILAGLLLPLLIVLGFLQSPYFSFELLTHPGLLNFLTFLFGANLSLAIFNMIPAFPLDGGRVFRAMLGFVTDYGTATQIAATVGQFLAIALGLVAVFSGQFWLVLIALFIFFVGRQEAQAVVNRNTLMGQGQAMSVLPANNAISLPPEVTVGQAAALMPNVGHSGFAVLDPTNGRLLGVASADCIRWAMANGQWHRRISEIMYHCTLNNKI